MVQPALSLAMTAFFTGSLLHSDHRREERGALCQRIRLGHLGLVQRVVMLSALAFLDERTARVNLKEARGYKQTMLRKAASASTALIHSPGGWQI